MMQTQYKNFASIFGQQTSRLGSSKDGFESPDAGPYHARYAIPQTYSEAKRQPLDIVQPQKSKVIAFGGASVASQSLSSEPSHPKWVGKSGKNYPVTEIELERHYFDDAIIILSRQLDGEERALWVGTAAHIVMEPAQRALYKRAISQATGAFKLNKTGQYTEFAGMIWDVQEGSLAQKQVA